MSRPALATPWIIAAFLATEACTTQDVMRATPYSGSRLEGTAFLCTSHNVTAGGFLTDPGNGRVQQVSELTRESNVTTWRITLGSDDAVVASFSGATALGTPDAFRLRRTADALTLARQEGLGSQTITIDLTNSSFMYSGQSMGPFVNKLNVFAGSCLPYL